MSGLDLTPNLQHLIATQLYYLFSLKKGILGVWAGLIFPSSLLDLIFTVRYQYALKVIMECGIWWMTLSRICKVTLCPLFINSTFAEPGPALDHGIQSNSQVWRLQSGNSNWSHWLCTCYVLGTTVSYTLSWLSQWSYKVGSKSPILKMRKPKHGEIKNLPKVISEQWCCVLAWLPSTFSVTFNHFIHKHTYPMFGFCSKADCNAKRCPGRGHNHF